MGAQPWQTVFERNRPIQSSTRLMKCGSCGKIGYEHPTRAGCVSTCDNPSGAPNPSVVIETQETTAMAHAARPRPAGPMLVNVGGQMMQVVPIETTPAANAGNANANSAGVIYMPFGANAEVQGQPVVEVQQPTAIPTAQTQPGAAAQWTGQAWPMPAPGCPPIGAPYPVANQNCYPCMDPRRPGKVYGCDLPLGILKCNSYQEAAKQLCWTEKTIRSPAAVAPGDEITFLIEVKWWWQIQAILNVGEQDVASFDLTAINYGQSDYNLQFERYEVDGVGTPQNGIDVRRWNAGTFMSHYYPMPACGLNDPIELVFENVGGVDADLELILGGPSVLQIG